MVRLMLQLWKAAEDAFRFDRWHFEELRLGVFDIMTTLTRAQSDQVKQWLHGTVSSRPQDCKMARQAWASSSTQSRALPVDPALSRK